MGEQLDGFIGLVAKGVVGVVGFNDKSMDKVKGTRKCESVRCGSEGDIVMVVELERSGTVPPVQQRASA